MFSRVGLFLIVALATSVLIGCGGGSNISQQNADPTLQWITITPTTTTSIAVGSALQFDATGEYSNLAVKNLTGTVTWSASPNTNATVSSAGIVTGEKGGTVTITAAYGSISTTKQLTVVPVLQSVTLTPVGPAILVGGQQQFTATGSFNDGSSQDLTTSATWQSSNATSASISKGLVTSKATGPVNITATVNGVSGSTALNVVSEAFATLRGNYAFSLESSDQRGAALYVGSILADGAGNFGGVEDCNTAGGVQQNLSVSGTYLIYPDGRGNIIFNPNQCQPKGVTLRVILASGGSSGGLAEFDGLATTEGTLLQQNPANFQLASINGSYVFRAAGIDTRVNASGLVDGLGEIGMFSANGTGAISGGFEDINDNGIVSGQVALSSSAYSVGSNGRGTLQMITSSGTNNYAIYIIDSTSFLFIQTDAVEAVSGVAELQDAQVYSSLSSTFSFLIEPPVVIYAGNPSPLDDHVQIGKLNFEASGTFGGTRDDDHVTGTYVLSQSGINGRGVMQMTSDDNRIYFFYMVSASRMFILQAFTYSQTQRVSPATGEGDVQTGSPYGVATLTGTYAMAVSNLAQNATNLTWLSMDGTGSVEGVSDLSGEGVVSSTVLSDALFVTTPTTFGNGDLQMNNPAGIIDYLFYLVSPEQAWVVGLNPPLDGSLEKQ